MEFPLSALAIMALFFLSLDLMEFISLASGCVLCVGCELLF
jgi:diacylglycerol kinase